MDAARAYIAALARCTPRLESARAEMDALDHRFLYFIEAGADRGRVLYLRVDGDYGLVQPW